MNNYLLAILFSWCLYNTWAIHHNYKGDTRSNILDQMTLKVLQIHCQRLDRIEDKLGIKHDEQQNIM